jgi:hypothetical protein
VPTPEQIAAATSRLDPESRAVIELFGKRGMSADEIADLLGSDPDEIERRHEAALNQLERELAVERKAEPEPAPAAAKAAAAAAVTTPSRPETGRRRLVIGLAALAAVVIVVIAIAVAGGSDNSSDNAGGGPGSTDVGATSPSGGTTTKPEAGKVRTFDRLNGTFGHGTVQLIRTGSKATLRLDATGFLQPVGGGYSVWLYNSQTDARRLYATPGTSIKRDIPLPPNYTRYRYAEVARAVPQLNSPHSGLSLLRAKLSDLTR